MPHEPLPSPSIRSATGSVKPHPQRVRLLDDVFVPAHLCRACPAEGALVTLLAVRTINAKKRRMGWTAIARVSEGVVAGEPG